MTRRALAYLLLSTLATFGARSARAEGAATDPKDVSRQRYQQGAAAYAAGHYMDAIDLFLDADRLAPNPAFAYNIGLAYEELGDAPDALRWYRSYLRALPNAPDRSDIEPRILQAEQRLHDRGVQQVTVLSVPDGATVALDGRRVGVTPWSGEAVPGTHQITLELPGFGDATNAFELPPDHAVDVSLSLEPAGPKVAGTASPTPGAGTSEQPGTSSRVRPLTWTALGVGVAGLGAALGFELARSAAVSSAHSETNIEGKDRYDQATTYQTVSRVSLGVGSAFAVAGGVLLYFDLAAKSSGTVKVGTAAGCTGALCGMVMHGAF